MEATTKAVGALVGERRGKPRYHLLTRVDIPVPCDGQVYWGSLNNVSWTGAALSVRQFMKPGQTVTIRFHFHGEEGREVMESLIAKVLWRNGDNIGLEFEPSLMPGSPAFQKVPFLVIHIRMQEAWR